MASWDCTLQSRPWDCPRGCLLPKVDQTTRRDWPQPAPMDLGREAPQRVPSYTVADGDCKWDLHFLWNLCSWKPWTSLRTGKVLVQQAKLPNLKYQHTGHAKGVRWGWKLPQVNSSWLRRWRRRGFQPVFLFSRFALRLSFSHLWNEGLKELSSLSSSARLWL